MEQRPKRRGKPTAQLQLVGIKGATGEFCDKTDARLDLCVGRRVTGGSTVTIKEKIIMPYDLEKILVIGISSRALFDLEKENDILINQFVDQ